MIGVDFRIECNWQNICEQFISFGILHPAQMNSPRPQYLHSHSIYAGFQWRTQESLTTKFHPSSSLPRRIFSDLIPRIIHFPSIQSNHNTPVHPSPNHRLSIHLIQPRFIHPSPIHPPIIHLSMSRRWLWKLAFTALGWRAVRNNSFRNSESSFEYLSISFSRSS